MKYRYLAIVSVALLALSACGGGGGGSGDMSGDPPPVQNASPGGIWTGTDPVTGLQIEGLVDESGNFHFIRADGVQYIGTASTSGNSLSGGFDGYTDLGTAWPDGSTHGSGSLTGTIAERQSINGQVSFKTDAGNNSGGALSLTFNTLYNLASSIGVVEGSYGDAAGDVAEIYYDGTVFYQSTATGCSGNGTISAPTPQYNVYSVIVTITGCNASLANNATLKGLATYDNAVSPAQLIVGLEGSGVAIAMTLNKN